MRLRFVVVAAFALMALAPAYLAYDAGILPGPAQASADDAAGGAPISRVAPLAWPEEALGLAATGSTVFWEQRDPKAAIAGLWSYDVRTGRVDRLLDRSLTGKAAGFPASAGDLVVWAAWAGRRGAGAPRIEAYDMANTRRWTAAQAGRDPTAAGETVIWVEPDSSSGDVIRGVNTLTDEEYVIETGGHVRHVAAWGSWAAWITGRGDKARVWAGSYRHKTRHDLAGAGTAVAVDHDRVVWAAAVGRHTSRLVSWDRKAQSATALCRVDGAVSALTLSRNYAAWVTTTEATGAQVWVYDFAQARAFPAAETGARQASPVIVAGSVYWADDRDGDWHLYRRVLR